ncbi:MAG: 50S ribosomal protein L37e [Nanoarchaeota archaeon]
MTKGTSSMGVKSGKKTHIACRRCGEHAYHVTKKKCASCGFGKTATMRKYKWNKKSSGN